MVIYATRQTSRRHRVKDWLQDRIFAMLQYDTSYWRFAYIGLWCCISAVLALTALGIPSGFGVWFDIFTLLMIGTFAMAAVSAVIACLLSFLYVPIPRFFAGGFLFIFAVLFKIFDFSDLEGFVGLTVTSIAALILLIISLAGGLLGSSAISYKTKGAAVMVFLAVGWAAVYWPSVKVEPMLAQTQGDNQAALSLDNPSREGSYPVHYLTYGSGSDRNRDEYGQAVDLISASVDSSAYISKWSRLRTAFWGFDEKNLPINGRVWMPEGEGPYPLVLIVHGNHLMEQFSDSGYAYLGEMLASRGFITVSVDENFLNYSVWSGIPDQDMKVRAWVLLKHLQQMEAFNKQVGSPLYGKIDLSRTALIGHSRGGQAVAMAADGSRWFAEDKSLTGMDNISIKAVIAIAPTDKAVDKKFAQLEDIDYLTLQGARDGDVDDFYGDQQYIRTELSAGSDEFKAALYIADANHSQFNTDWGSFDDSLPGGLLLNLKDIMDGTKQRQVAKVYVSAFLEAALHEDFSYEPLFRDYRTGSNWLPETQYFSRYQSGDFQEITDYEGVYNKSVPGTGVKANAKGMASWELKPAQNRDRDNKGTRGAELQWSKQAQYTLTLSDALRKEENPSANKDYLTFSMVLLNRDLTKNGMEIDVPQIEVEIRDRKERAAKLPLDHFMDLQPLPQVQYSLFPILEKRIGNGKYRESVEPVFQTYMLPLAAFKALAPEMRLEELSSISFYFSGGPGKVMLDDVGFEGK